MFKRDQQSSRDKNDKNSHHFKTPREKKLVVYQKVC